MVTIFFIILLGIHAIRVTISLYTGYYLLKRFFAKHKTGSTCFTENQENGMENKYSFLKYVMMSKIERNSYLYFEKEFFGLMQFMKGSGSIIEIKSMCSLFFAGVKERIFKRMTTIISTVGLLILAEFYVTVNGFSMIAEEIAVYGHTSVGAFFAIIREFLFEPFPYFIIVSLLCLIMYRILKKKYYLIVEETNKIIDHLIKEKSS